MEKRFKRKPVRVYNEALKQWEFQYEDVAYYRYSEDEKIQIVSDYVQSGCQASEIVEKYHLSGKQILLTWVGQFVKAEESLSLPSKQNEDPMAKKNPDERIRELEAENRRLEKALELEKLRAKAYDTMINVAEETFNIPIRKKSGTKQ